MAAAAAEPCRVEEVAADVGLLRNELRTLATTMTSEAVATREQVHQVSEDSDRNAAEVRSAHAMLLEQGRGTLDVQRELVAEIRSLRDVSSERADKMATALRDGMQQSIDSVVKVALQKARPVQQAPASPPAWLAALGAALRSPTALLTVICLALVVALVVVLVERETPGTASSAIAKARPPAALAVNPDAG